MPAVPPCIIEPIWQQFAALLREREVNHPLGCHRPRVPDRVVLEKLLQILVFDCAYWRIADSSCSATMLRRRRDEWIEADLMDALEVIYSPECLEARSSQEFSGRAKPLGQDE
jgi:hypothetical protein